MDPDKAVDGGETGGSHIVTVPRLGRVHLISMLPSLFSSRAGARATNILKLK